MSGHTYIHTYTHTHIHTHMTTTITLAANAHRGLISGVGISNIMRKSVYMYITSLQHPLTTPIQTEVWIANVESEWNLWVWLVCVVSRRWVWLVCV